MPTLGESMARRRVFWAMVALAVAPAVALLAYGLAGVKDRADAEEGRLHERYTLQARAIEAEVLAALAAEDDRVREALAAVPAESLGEAATSYPDRSRLVSKVWTLDDPDAPPDAQAAALVLSARAPVSFVTASAGDDSALAVSRLREGLVVAYRIDAAAIDAVVVPEIVGRKFSTEGASYRLGAVAADPAGEPVSFDALRRSLALQLLEDEPFVVRPLAPPFGHWRVEVNPPPAREAPAESALRWTMILLFAATVVGVIIMGRAIAQQVRLSRLQTDFVSNVSHELRTPLTSIRMFVETLQSGRVKDPERVQECLDVIAAETERLSKKIERVLTWARMEAGRRIYEIQPLRPCDIAERAVNAFRAHDLDGDDRLEVTVPEALPRVHADADAVAEALINLLGNARKYGGDKVKIRFLAREESGGVSFAVEDDGPGISLVEQRRVFDKFYRSNNLLSRRTEGSGLGLAIVAGIVAAHKGRVSLESVEGAGSRFSIWLPLAR
ncbi:MAG: HAMP domain-containing histidine kinase [Deltaproteobacteria bacterium]|nr:HAMP domain-containing histidine kinase [Deltaproteobacteria bacterium]